MTTVEIGDLVEFSYKRSALIPPGTLGIVKDVNNQQFRASVEWLDLEDDFMGHLAVPLDRLIIKEKGQSKIPIPQAQNLPTGAVIMQNELPDPISTPEGNMAIVDGVLYVCSGSKWLRISA